mmetsp:Transcript_8283/g.6177  ORF Transcript_8283/g.6177 Transcript_8283/m.6177 type:complete len:109 (+) Transcript_8283:2124-2450(+)
MGDQRKTKMGLLGTVLASFMLPSVGVIFGTTVFLLMGYYGTENILKKLILELLGMIALVIFVYFSYVLAKTNFGLFGLELSYILREKIYKSILRKHISWFEETEHSSG